MIVRSHDFTNRIRNASGELAYVEPGVAFEVTDEKGREKIHAGRAELVEEQPARGAAKGTPAGSKRRGRPASQAGNQTDPAGSSQSSTENGDDPLEAAILELDENVPTNWMADGRPSVEALSTKLGRTVSDEERDKAWSSLQG